MSFSRNFNENFQQNVEYFRETNSQELALLLCDQSVRCFCHKGWPFVPVLSHINPVQILFPAYVRYILILSSIFICLLCVIPNGDMHFLPTQDLYTPRLSYLDLLSLISSQAFKFCLCLIACHANSSNHPQSRLM